MFGDLGKKITGTIRSVIDLIPDEAETLTEFFSSARKSGKPIEIRSDCQIVDISRDEYPLVVGDNYYLTLKSMTEKGKEVFYKIKYGFLAIDFKPEDKNKLPEYKAEKLKEILSWVSLNFPDVKDNIVEI